jgi:CheY-like chemotaxis protein
LDAGAAPEGGVSQTRKRILVVDDDDAMRELETAILGDIGYEVREASGGAEAIALASAWSPDLMLLDLMMPGINGWDVLQHVSTLPRPPRVLVVTGMNEAVPPGHLTQSVAGYLFKPFKIDQLVNNCKTVLEAPSVWDPPGGKRKESRRLYVAETTLLSRDGVPLAVGQLRDVSRKGFCIQLAIPVSEGDPVRVAFRVPGRDEPLRLNGRVVWRSDNTLGAELDELTPEQEAELRLLLEEGE